MLRIALSLFPPSCSSSWSCCWTELFCLSHVRIITLGLLNIFYGKIFRMCTDPTHGQNVSRTDNSIWAWLSSIWFCYFLQVDLTEYVEKHEFVFDAVLDEKVSNDEVSNKRKTCIYFCINYRVCILNFLLIFVGISWDCGAHCSYNFSADQGNLLCVWANR